MFASYFTLGNDFRNKRDHVGGRDAKQRWQLLHKKKVNKSTTADNSAEPDKVLYLRAQDDIKHGAPGSGAA